MEKKKNSIMPGIVLITIGIWFLARHWTDSSLFWYRTYPLLMLGFSGFLFLETRRRANSGALFWAVALLIVGGFYILRNYGMLEEYYLDEYWPVYMLAAGIAFIVMFIVNPKEWGVLIPGALLSFFGGTQLLENLDDNYWEYGNYFEEYWPVILIVIGTGVIISGVTQSRKKEEISE
ncbi:hypothetical protein JW979_05700 [bacterium]|nr:hypothetical protein [candidate division CSSED10-310 bacterium]